jgi:GT2 family glycosyltransferase
MRDSPRAGRAVATITGGTRTPGLLSIIIVNLNTCELLRRCLESLQRSAYRAIDIVVVDNGSQDGSPDMVKESFPNVKIVRLPRNIGFVGGNLEALPFAAGEFICFLNSDTEIEPDAFIHLVDYLDEHPKVGCCEPKLLWMKDPTRLDSIGDWLTWTGMLFHRGYLQKDLGLTQPFPIFAAKGACIVLRGSLLDEIGAFDDSYFAYFEETDLCWRIWLSGYEVHFVPDARVNHLLAGTSQNLNAGFVTFHAFKNRLQAMIKNFGPNHMVRIVPIHLAICLGLIFLYAIRGDKAKAKAILRALWWNAQNLRKTLAKRRHIQGNIRKVSDQDLMSFAIAPVGMRYFWSLYREYERV